MKILFTLIAIIFLFLSVFPQQFPENRCPYKGPQIPSSLRSDTVGNFTIQTTDGITRNLYNTLDSGKTVFIDLFYTTCSWCQYYAPIIEEVYQNHGAGQGDIEFWGISNNLQDYNTVIDQYRQNYNITNPCAGPQGGGTTAHTVVISGQNFQGWPTYCVVCPDRTMFFDPCYPPIVTGFDPFFEVCAAMVGVDNNPSLEQPMIQAYPNPAKETIFLQIQSKYKGNILVEIYNLLGLKVLSSIFYKEEETSSSPLNVSALPAGAYFLRITDGKQVLSTLKVSITR
jgi:thiol-disulfide isomerase/thioredoxin